jgi:hypothetical protein
LNISERHHYLPEFYIKGFVGNDNKVSVFNKVKYKLDPIRKSPKQIFFEWNRNTFEVNGKKTDFVEKLHQFGEDKFAPTYNKIVENIEKYELNPYDTFQLMLFIATTYRRIPNQDESIFDYLKKFDPDNSIFQIKNRKTGENAPKNLTERIFNDPSFIESSKIIRAMDDYFKIDRVTNAKNWKLSYVSQDSPQLHLLSDNPLILQENNSNIILDTILIFPLAKGIVAYNTKDKTIKNIPPEHTVNLDLFSFIQADKMVCGPNKDYLEKISELAKLYDSDEKVSYLKNKVFKIFE